MKKKGHLWRIIVFIDQFNKQLPAEPFHLLRPANCFSYIMWPLGQFELETNLNESLACKSDSKSQIKKIGFRILSQINIIKCKYNNTFFSFDIRFAIHKPIQFVADLLLFVDFIHARVQ